ncbi:hypothetical protein HUE87_06605 [Candidatus Sulfurimonas marisnigri]|uniref:Lipoprotein n=1 Tax=Candidatus Sulfurimonas marisnigri TaxID=2740405 RepID=A0A7S7RPJ0_9BACT|nr:hypothetical protein [Candidatus Sulfurimonas marisnigri]QOY53593.1 hypothetical protein HUE87_06605 [Candidatus Sulfurimonas marisnigri]
MKSFFLFFIFLILLAGCSNKNAFKDFKMSKEQELSVSSLQSSKVVSDKGEISGVFSAIYLNDVYPELYNDNDYFFVYMYVKKSPQHEPNLKLNSKPPVKLQELPKDNKFSHLALTKSDWNRYYIATFSKDNNDSISLVFESGQSSSAVLKYQKGEQ